MNADSIVITERDAPGHCEVSITFTERLADGNPPGCWLGMGGGRLLMTREHFDALRERLRRDDAVDALGAALAERDVPSLTEGTL